MYRCYTKKDISSLLTIYNGCNNINNNNQLTETLDTFISAPSASKLMQLLCDININEQTKRAALASLNVAINYTSIKSFTNKKNRAILANILYSINTTPVYTPQELTTIIKFINNKGLNTINFTQQQTLAIKNYFDLEGIPGMFSSGGSTDYYWINDEAKADGILYPNTTNEIIIYARYGSSTGGEQNHRYRSMFSAAKKNPNKRFLFVCDGIEALLQWNICQSCLKTDMYSNALWTTIKLLPQINFPDLTFV